jgi:hypothetical protein
MVSRTSVKIDWVSKQMLHDWTFKKEGIIFFSGLFTKIVQIYRPVTKLED